MSRRPIEKPGPDTRGAEPDYTWGEIPAGAPPIVWEHAARPLWAQAVPGRDAVLLSEKDRLQLRQVSTGAPLWQRPGPAPPEALAVDHAGLVLAAGQDAWELDPLTGGERWRKRLGGSVTTLALDRGSAYAVSAQRSRGFLFALDRRSGASRWRAPCGAEAEVTVHENLGLLLLSDGHSDTLEAFDTGSGAKSWEFAAEDEPVAAGPLAGSVLVVSAHEYGAAGVDARTGALRWRLESPRGFETVAAALGDAVFLTDGAMHGVDASTGQVRWRREPAEPGDRFFSATVADGTLLADTWRGGLLALDPETGSTLWESRPGQVQGCAVDASRLYARLSIEGRPAAPWGVLALDRESGKLLWELLLRRMPPDLTVVGGILLVEMKNRVVALDVSAG